MLLRLAITAAILAYLATRIDMAEAARATAAISRPHLMLVLLMVALDRAVMILRWVLLLRASGNPISTADATRLFLVSSFVGSFLPAGVGADAARAYGLARREKHQPAAKPWRRWRWIDSLGSCRSCSWPSSASSPGRRKAALTGASRLASWWRSLPVWPCSGPTSGCAGSSQRGGTRASSPAGCCVSRMRWAAIAIGAACSSTCWSGRSSSRCMRITQAYVLALGLGMTVPFTYFLLFMPLGC